MTDQTQPPLSPAQQQGIQPRAYHKRTPRWYHSHIIDWMMANPNGKLGDCAAYVGKGQNTLSAIIRSDMFQAALALRKQQYASQQDLVITKKLTEVSIASLDMILDVIDKKRNSLPLETLNTVADGALKRLGYGVETKAPPVQVNVQGDAQIVTSISREDLEAARLLARQNQQRLSESQTPLAANSGVSQLSGSAAASRQEGAPVGGFSTLEGEILPPEPKEAAQVKSSEGGR